MLAILLPAFAVMFWWQLHRALGGNKLSWAYTIEWPIFAGYAIFMWWKLIHDDFGPSRARETPRSSADDDEDARQLAAYNAYLAQLQEEDETERRRVENAFRAEAAAKHGPLPRTQGD